VETIIQTVFKTFIALGSLVIVTRLMGRRSIAQLTLYDYVIGLILGNIGASFAVGGSVSISEGLASLMAATVWVLGVNFFTQRNLVARKFIDSEPIIVIYQGRILEENLKKKFYNINDLLRALREQGIFDPNDVEIAVIESDGQISAMERKKIGSQNSQENSHGNLSEGYSKLVGRELIIDGKIIDRSLEESGITAEWIENRLADQNAKLNDVTLAMIAPDGKLYIDVKDDKSIILDHQFGQKLN
jgi:uncharacterized membrane protein YcaP (DUF421 family)